MLWCMCERKIPGLHINECCLFITIKVIFAFLLKNKVNQSLCGWAKPMRLDGRCLSFWGQFLIGFAILVMIEEGVFIQLYYIYFILTVKPINVT